MERTEVLNKTRELVSQIYAKMNVIESCDAVAEHVKNLDVCFNDPEAGKVVILDEILSEEQRASIREIIINRIYENAIDAQSFLERLNRKPATINPEFEAAIQSMVHHDSETVELHGEPDLPPETFAEPDPIEEGSRAVLNQESDRITNSHKEPSLDKYPAKKSKSKEVMTVDEVTTMVTVRNMTRAEIAKHFGVSQSELNNFMTRNKIKRGKEQA